MPYLFGSILTVSRSDVWVIAVLGLVIVATLAVCGRALFAIVRRRGIGAASPGSPSTCSTRCLPRSPRSRSSRRCASSASCSSPRSWCFRSRPAACRALVPYDAHRRGDRRHRLGRRRPRGGALLVARAGRRDRAHDRRRVRSGRDDRRRERARRCRTTSARIVATPDNVRSVTRRMDGERALVTGSTSGIGRAIAIAFRARRRGASSSPGAIRHAATPWSRRSHGGGGAAVFIAADLDDEDACTALVAAAAERLGGLTVLVNNAAGGGAPDGPVADLTTDAWDAILRVDLTAPMWCARAAIPHMRARGARLDRERLVRQAERASPGLAAYVAAKAGLNGLTRAIAVDEARRRHPLQHDQPRLRAQRPPRRRHLRRAARPLRGHAPHPPRRRRRRRVRRGVPREPRVGVRHRHQPRSSTAAAASPAASRSGESQCDPASCVSAISTFQLVARRRPRVLGAPRDHNVGVSVAKLGGVRLGRGDEARRRCRRRAASTSIDLIGLGPFHLAAPDRWDGSSERLVRAIETAAAVGADRAWCSRPDRSRRSRGTRRPTRSSRARAGAHRGARPQGRVRDRAHELAARRRRLRAHAARRDRSRAPARHRRVHGDERVLGRARSRRHDPRRNRPHPARAGERLQGRDGRVVATARARRRRHPARAHPRARWSTRATRACSSSSSSATRSSPRATTTRSACDRASTRCWPRSSTDRRPRRRFADGARDRQADNVRREERSRQLDRRPTRA